MAAAVDAHVTVSGFVVKQPFVAAKSAPAAAEGAAGDSAGWREEGARGLLRLSAALAAPTPPPKDQVRTLGRW